MLPNPSRSSDSWPQYFLGPAYGPARYPPKRSWYGTSRGWHAPAFFTLPPSFVPVEPCVDWSRPVQTLHLVGRAINRFQVLNCLFPINPAEFTSISFNIANKNQLWFPQVPNQLVQSGGPCMTGGAVPLKDPRHKNLYIDCIFVHMFFPPWSTFTPLSPNGLKI